LSSPGGAHVAAGRAADAQVDAARRQRVQHAELLGHLEGRVVRQHHPGAADADACRVRAAMAASRISGAVPTMVGRPWCSLTQKRW
jgi:hypothetical protein